MIVLVCGTRPELIKLWPVCHELVQRKHPFRVLFTGQHTTLASTVNFLDTFKDHVTSVGCVPEEGEHPWRYVARATGEVIDWMHFDQSGVRWIVVQGDTSSALAGARAATQMDIPLAHVEAGLRTYDFSDPYPEEHFRVEVTHLASLHFAVTTLSQQNLIAEGVKESNIAVVGNTVVDMLRLHDIIPTPSRHRRGILVTLHRRESAGQPMANILDGLSQFHRQHPDIPISLVSHPNGLSASVNPGFDLLPPMPYLDFVRRLSASQAVLTDSGGVVEEATTLNVPCVIARNHTERPEALGWPCFLAGTSPTSIRIGINFCLTEPEPLATNPFGSGYSAKLIVDSLIGR